MGNYTSQATGEAVRPSDAFFLSEATRTGSLDIVQLFLKKNPALVYATSASDGSTPWHVATSAGHELVLRVLIDTTRANAVSNNFSPLSKVINKQNAKGQTPLMLACGGGFSVCVRLLLESGAHLLVADAMGRSALHYAALHSHPDGRGHDCVELLLAHMQEQLIKQGPAAAPPAVHGNVIRKFADATDMYGRTALHCAAWSGNARAVHALWAVGADICARTDTDCYDTELPCNTGTTPLHFAAMRGNQNVVVLLLAAWHRMVTRPSAPLPRASFARASLPPSSRPSHARLPSSEAAGGGGAAAEESQPLAQQRSKQQQEPLPPLPASQPQQAGEKSEGKEEAAAQPPGEGGGGSGAGASPSGPANDHVRTPDQEGGAQAQTQEAAQGAGAADGVSRAQQEDGRGAERTAEGDAAGAAVTAEGAEGRAPQAEPEQGGARSGRSSSSGSHGEGAAFTPLLLEMPRPPSPRPPAGDPRLMVDAYGMTPYSIACRRREDFGKMLIELLDPSTDFAAGEAANDDDDRDDQAAAADGGAAAASDGLLRRQRYGGGRRGGGGDEEDSGEGDESDSDSEAGAAGPLLLWEGVELIQGIAAEPESFFKLQSTAPLLQPRQQDDPPAASSAAAGGGGRGGGGAGGRASLVSLAGGVRRSSSGASSLCGPGGRSGRQSALLEEAVPDCFLCPLTCQLFRDPVVAADGVTYEREAIERHLKIVPTSPVTKQRLASTAVYPNTALKRAIEHWTSMRAGQRHTGTGLIGRP